MDLRIHKFILSKRGANPNECEDAFGINIGNRMFAVADGATEAFDSRTWARLLAKAWVRIHPAAFEETDFGPLVRDLGIRLRRKWSKKTLPWYAEEKARQGSFAAFVGLQILNENTMSWRAVALGDCCLIHRQGTALCESFPISSPAEFGNNPRLLPSDATSQANAMKLLRLAEGKTAVGNDFLLLSDAVGCWFLKQLQASQVGAIEEFDSLTGNDRHEELSQFFEAQRDAGTIRNDDITIVRVVLS